MSLGTTLAADLEAEFTTFIVAEATKTAVVAAQRIAWIIDDYLVGGIVGGGSFTYASSVDYNLLILDPTTGTAAIAANKWATALEDYFSSATITLVTASAASLIYANVKSSLEASLLPIFQVNTNTSQQQANAIASAIQTAVGTVGATYTIGSTTTTEPSGAIS